MGIVAADKSRSVFVKRTLLAAILCLAPLSAHACGNGASCALGERSYQAKAPAEWDGTSALPVMLHFHGWGRTGTNVIRNKRIYEATDANGVLLLAPDGLGKSWSFWNDNPRDIDFAEAVLADAATRWPIDPKRIYISGFSYGSAMAWAMACDSGDKYAGFLGIAGTLSSIERRDCRTGPFSLRQVHGQKDNVMRPPWGSNGGAWNKALSLAKCRASTSAQAGRYERRTWAACGEGRSVQLDRHTGGHWIPKGWIEAQLRDLLSR